MPKNISRKLSPASRNSNLWWWMECMYQCKIVIKLLRKYLQTTKIIRHFSKLSYHHLVNKDHKTSNQGEISCLQFAKLWNIANRTNYNSCSNKLAALTVQSWTNISSDVCAYCAALLYLVEKILLSAPKNILAVSMSYVFNKQL